MGARLTDFNESIAKLSGVKWLYLGDNDLTNINISGLQNIEELGAQNNLLESLTLGNNPLLYSCSVSDNPELASYTVTGPAASLTGFTFINTAISALPPFPLAYINLTDTGISGNVDLSVYPELNSVTIDQDNITGLTIDSPYLQNLSINSSSPIDLSMSNDCFNVLLNVGIGAGVLTQEEMEDIMVRLAAGTVVGGFLSLAGIDFSTPTAFAARTALAGRFWYTTNV